MNDEQQIFLREFFIKISSAVFFFCDDKKNYFCFSGRILLFFTRKPLEDTFNWAYNDSHPKSVLSTAGMDCCDMVSDSSGVCTSNSGSAESYDATPTDVTQFDMGMLVVCLQQYAPHKAGHLDINAGDILEGQPPNISKCFNHFIMFVIFNGVLIFSQTAH